MSQRIALGAVVYGLLALYFLVLLVPLSWSVLAALGTDARIMSAAPWPTLSDLTLQNYQSLLMRPQFRRYLLNSLIVASLSSAVTVLFASMAAYGLSRYRIVGKRFILVAVLTSKMFPLTLLLVPIFTVFLAYGLLNTYGGVVLAHVAVSIPFALWVTKAYFDQIPVELEEAALIDGCSRLGVIFRILFPVAAPGLVFVALYSFVISWHEYLIVSLIGQSPEVATLPLGLITLMSSIQSSWGTVLAAVNISIMPPILLYTLAHKKFVEGWAAAAT